MLVKSKEFIKENIFKIIAAIYSLVLFYINFKRIFDEHVWLDEAFTGDIIRLSIPDLIARTAADVHPPLYYFLVKGFCAVFGEHGWSLHFVSLIPLIILIVFSLICVWDKFGAEAAIILITLSTISDTALRYNVEIRMYSWCAVLILLTYYALYRIIEDNNKRDYILFTVFSLAAAYMHYYALIAVAFLYVALVLYSIIFRRKAIGKSLIVCAVAIVCYLPWLTVLLQSMTSRIDNYWITDIPTFANCFTYIFSEKFTTWMWGLAIIMLILTVMYELKILRVEKIDSFKCTLELSKHIECSNIVLLIIAGMMSIVGTMAVGIGVSKLISPFFVTRYIYVVCQVAWLILGILFSKMKMHILWGTIFVVMLIYTFIPSYTAIKEWDELCNNRLLLVLNQMDTISDDDVIMANFDSEYYSEFYFADVDFEMLDYDLTTVTLPELDEGTQYWLFVYDDWDLTNINEQLSSQGYQMECVVGNGMIGYSNAYIYKIVSIQ